MKIKYIITTLFFLGHFISFSQKQTETKGNGGEVALTNKVIYPLSVFVGIGTTSYYGQLASTQHSFKTLNYQINLGIKYRISPRFCVGGLFRHAALAGSDAKSDVKQPEGGGRFERNLSFRTPIYNLEVFGTFDILPFMKYYGDGSLEKGVNLGVAPYLIAGIGVMYFNPTAELNGERYSLRKIYTSLEKQQNGFYSPITFLVTYGAGMRVSLTRMLDLGVDLTFTNTFTDNLDDLASQSHYPDKSQIPVIDAQLADRYALADRTTTDLRSNSKGKILDSYFMLNIKLEYTLPFGNKKDSKRIHPAGHRNFQKNKGSKNHKFDLR
ncbi:MAG: hypothetical protein EAZ53_00635 [Bacteroidetes bacterium]|nr:MAG: hypothetical protein EAZ53_00635 [Bacteroidota bacterium]